MEVSCWNWVSGGGQLQYHVTYNSTQFPVVVYSGPQASSRFVIPAGPHLIGVTVSDSSGATTHLPPVLLIVPRFVVFYSLEIRCPKNYLKIKIDNFTSLTCGDSYC